ncbi:type VII secretion protein EccB [Kitasatospora sp. NPDC092948]|uniref:type VII secretion protein EccB n=1 Tax=Kitasatospora sp. NPDC092948 TaxID=3364088 RepID=UPI0037FEC7A7
MASRRDELNAYTFARKRMVGAFLQPGGGGNDEDAPRPIRAVLPSFVIGAVVVAGFGMWGVIKPSAPPNWDNGKYILQGKSSTTRYVILPDPKTNQPTLHQVLNMSSARLVLSEGATVQTVADEVLDKYPRRGAAIGIPYAPDKLPEGGDAGASKLWSVCDKQGQDNKQSVVGQSVFIAAGADAKTLQGDRKLGDGQSLFVQEPDIPNQSGPATPGSMYLVDGNGVKHAVGTAGTDGDKGDLTRALFGQQVKPQRVTKDWIDTLDDGDPIVFPRIQNIAGNPSGASSLELSQAADRKVGRLLTFQDQYYLVGAQQLYRITEFQANLLFNDPNTQAAAYDGKPPTYGQLGAGDLNKLDSKVVPSLPGQFKGWPTHKSPAVNRTEKDPRTVICSTFNGYEGDEIKRSVWAGTSYPVDVSADSASAHVTPGHGLLYRSLEGGSKPGADGGTGSDFLITDSGLRYSLPANNDGGNGAASASPNPQGGAQKSTNEAQARLGYKSVSPQFVPDRWSKLVPAGPVLNTNTALQAQNA